MSVDLHSDANMTKMTNKSIVNKLQFHANQYTLNDH